MAGAIGDVYRVALTGGAPQSSVWQNVWHYELTTGQIGDETDILPAVAANYGVAHAAVDSLLHTSYDATSLELWKYNFATHKWNGLDTEALVGLDGLSAQDPVAHGVAAVGRFVTEVARRQGRTFLPGLIDTAVDLGLIDSAFLAAFTTYMDEFTDDLAVGNGTIELCTFNTDQTSVYYETTSVFQNTILISNIVGYQRRRKPLVGI